MVNSASINWTIQAYDTSGNPISQEQEMKTHVYPRHDTFLNPDDLMCCGITTKEGGRHETNQDRYCVSCGKKFKFGSSWCAKTWHLYQTEFNGVKTQIREKPLM